MKSNALEQLRPEPEKPKLTIIEEEQAVEVPGNIKEGDTIVWNDDRIDKVQLVKIQPANEKGEGGYFVLKNLTASIKGGDKQKTERIVSFKNFKVEMDEIGIKKITTKEKKDEIKNRPLAETKEPVEPETINKKRKSGPGDQPDRPINPITRKGGMRSVEDSEQIKSTPPDKKPGKMPPGYSEMLKNPPAPPENPTKTNEVENWQGPRIGDVITSRGGVNRKVFAIDQEKKLIGLEQIDTGEKRQMTFADYEKARVNIHNIQDRKPFDEKYDEAREKLNKTESLNLYAGQSIWTPLGEEVKVVEVVREPKTEDPALKEGYAVLGFQPKEGRNSAYKQEVVPFHKLLWAAEQGNLKLNKPENKTSKEKIEQLRQETKAAAKEFRGGTDESIPEQKVVGMHEGKPVIEGEFTPVSSENDELLKMADELLKKHPEDEIDQMIIEKIKVAQSRNWPEVLKKDTIVGLMRSYKLLKEQGQESAKKQQKIQGEIKELQRKEKLLAVEAAKANEAVRQILHWFGWKTK